MKFAAVVVAAALFLPATELAAQTAPVPSRLVPTGIAGAKTADGMRITSRQSPNPFSIEIGGKDIRALSAERLQWTIDGKTVELELAVFPASPLGEAELLKIHWDWQLAALRQDGWTSTGPAEPAACGGNACLVAR